MIWKKYKCIVDKYGIVCKDQEFLINDVRAQDLDGNSLDVETKFVKRHSNPNSDDSYEFEFIGEVDDQADKEKVEEKDVTPEPKEEEPKTLEKKKSNNGKYVLLFDDEVNRIRFDTLDEARAVAECEAECGAIIAEVESELKIKKIQTWEA